jgi:ankyrin repeat protein
VNDTQNIRGDTALYFAIKYGHTQAVQLLLEHGADVNVRNEDGNTPSKLASSELYKHQEIVELLSAHASGSESVKK